MVYCSKCGKKIDGESNYCDQCGKSTVDGSDKNLSNNIEDYAKNAAKKFEINAENFGKRMEKFGKGIEKRFDKSTKSFENWHDRYFGIFGPLIGSFLGLIILRIIIEIMALNPIDFPIMAKTSELLYPYQLIFFGLILLSSYSTYFSRKYDFFKLITPITSAIGFAAGIWIFSTIFNDLFDYFDNFPDFTFISNFIIDNIIMIFIIVVVIGYFINIAQLYNKRYWEENKKNE
jgi:hypothetical protein